MESKKPLILLMEALEEKGMTRRDMLGILTLMDEHPKEMEEMAMEIKAMEKLPEKSDLLKKAVEIAYS